MRGNASTGVWILLVWALLILFVFIPWAMRHSPARQDHGFGASLDPARK
jgi:hypothetical protein